MYFRQYRTTCYYIFFSWPTAKQVGQEQKIQPVTLLLEQFSRAISRVPTRTYFYYEIVTFRLVELASLVCRLLQAADRSQCCPPTSASSRLLLVLFITRQPCSLSSQNRQILLVIISCRRLKLATVLNITKYPELIYHHPGLNASWSNHHICYC